MVKIKNKKSKYYIISIFISFVLLPFLFFIYITEFSSDIILSFYYDNDNNTASVSLGSFSFIEKIKIPEKVYSEGKYYKVVSIKENGFANKKIKYIEIPSTIEKIEKGAFKNCTQLQNVKLSEGLTYIGEESFYNCKELTNLTLPSTVKTIENKAFSSSGLEKISFSSRLDRIEIKNNIFLNCENLKWFSVPETTKTVKNIFNQSNIEHIYIPSSVIKIENLECKSIYGEKETYAEEYAKEKNINFYTLENSSQIKFSTNQNIDGFEYLFKNQEKTNWFLAFENAQIQINITTEEDWEYKYKICDNKNNLIKETDTTNDNIIDLSNLNEGNYKISINFLNKYFSVLGDTQEYFIEIKKPPFSINEKGYIVKYNDNSVSNLTIEKEYYGIKIKGIDDSAFEGHNEIEQIKVKADLVSIGSNSFKNCLNLKDIQFENIYSLEAIENMAFEGTGLSSFIIGPHVLMGSNIFYKTNLKTIYFYNRQFKNLDGTESSDVSNNIGLDVSQLKIYCFYGSPAKKSLDKFNLSTTPLNWLSYSLAFKNNRTDMGYKYAFTINSVNDTAEHYLTDYEYDKYYNLGSSTSEIERFNRVYNKELFQNVFGLEKTARRNSQIIPYWDFIYRREIKTNAYTNEVAFKGGFFCAGQAAFSGLVNYSSRNDDGVYVPLTTVQYYETQTDKTTNMFPNQLLLYKNGEYSYDKYSGISLEEYIYMLFIAQFEYNLSTEYFYDNQEEMFEPVDKTHFEYDILNKFYSDLKEYQETGDTPIYLGIGYFSNGVKNYHACNPLYYEKISDSQTRVYIADPQTIADINTPYLKSCYIDIFSNGKNLVYHKYGQDYKIFNLDYVSISEIAKSANKYLNNKNN